MKIIVGLGNIGDKYTSTRHNYGFLFLDEFIKQIEKDQQIEIKWKEETKLKALTAKVPYNDEILFLAKPTTLMNLSGQSVSKILNFFKEPLKNLIVIYDDIDLPLGKTRIRQEGSAGTHNGMKSIIQDIGSQQFTRIRLGIESRGELTPKQQDLASFVLSDFTENESTTVEKSINEGIKELSSLISKK